MSTKASPAPKSTTSSLGTASGASGLATKTVATPASNGSGSVGASKATPSPKGTGNTMKSTSAPAGALVTPNASRGGVAKKVPEPSFSDDEYSSTSSESESDAESVGSTKRSAGTHRSARRPVVDAATYNKQQAAIEWAKATSKETAPKPTPKAASGTATIVKKETAPAKPVSQPVVYQPVFGRLIEAAEDSKHWYSNVKVDATVEPLEAEYQGPPISNALRRLDAAANERRNRGDDETEVGDAAAAKEVGRTPETSKPQTNTGVVPRVAPEEAAAVKPRRIYEEEDLVDANPSNIPEPGQAISRAEYLEMLKLLGEDAKREAEEERQRKAAAAVAAATNESKRKGSPAVEDADAGALGSRKRQGSNHVDAFNLTETKGTTSSTARPHPLAPRVLDNNDPLDPAAALQAYYQTKEEFSRQAAQIGEFQRQVSAFEDVLTSEILTNKITEFLETHHKIFLESRPSRGRGEYSHQEWALFNLYSEKVQDFIVARMGKILGGEFDVETFVQELFDLEEERIDLEEETRAGGGEASASSTSYLSLEAWDVLLSILKFENFLTVMDDFIEVYYGVELSPKKDLVAHPPPGSPSAKSPPPVTGGSATSSSTSPVQPLGLARRVLASSQGQGPSGQSKLPRQAAPLTPLGGPKTPIPTATTTATPLNQRRQSPGPATPVGTTSSAAPSASRSFREMKNLPSTGASGTTRR